MLQRDYTDSLGGRLPTRSTRLARCQPRSMDEASAGSIATLRRAEGPASSRSGDPDILPIFGDNDQAIGLAGHLIFGGRPDLAIDHIP
jgi:hypothetical protein